MRYGEWISAVVIVLSMSISAMIVRRSSMVVLLAQATMLA